MSFQTLGHQNALHAHGTLRYEMVVGLLSTWFSFNPLIGENEELKQGSQPSCPTAQPEAAAESWRGSPWGAGPA